LFAGNFSRNREIACSRGGKSRSTISRTPADVDSEVLVRDQIAEAGDIRPADLWFRVARVGGQMLHGLTDDHELEEERIVQQRSVLAPRSRHLTGQGVRGSQRSRH
jgi:hypothetical protein